MPVNRRFVAEEERGIRLLTKESGMGNEPGLAGHDESRSRRNDAILLE